MMLPPDTVAEPTPMHGIASGPPTAASATGRDSACAAKKLIANG